MRCIIQNQILFHQVSGAFGDVIVETEKKVSEESLNRSNLIIWIQKTIFKALIISHYLQESTSYGSIIIRFPSFRLITMRGVPFICNN